MTPINPSYSGYVYLLGTTAHGWYKIGKAKNPKVRLAQLGILLPFPMELIAMWQTDNRHLLEIDMHQKYSQYRINGEWFRFKQGHLYKMVHEGQPRDARIAFSAFTEDIRNRIEFGNIAVESSILLNAKPGAINYSGKVKQQLFREAVDEYIYERGLDANSKDVLKEAWDHVLKAFKEQKAVVI